jgi:CRP-like cAMP-binding protein
MPDNRHGRALREQGVQRAADRWWGHPDADRAIEAAESMLLAANGLSLLGMEVAPERCGLFAGLERAQCERLRATLQPRQLAAGERLFSQGDVGDALYLLGRGSISVVDRTRAQRFVSFSPGMCFGETAVLDGGGRTADAVADIDSTVYALPAAALAGMLQSDAAIAAQVYCNLAQHLSERLRAAAAAWRHAAG